MRHHLLAVTGSLALVACTAVSDRVPSGGSSSSAAFVLQPLSAASASGTVAVTPSSAAAWQASSGDARIVLTHDMTSELNMNALTEGGTEADRQILEEIQALGRKAPTTTARYTSMQYGVSFDVPYTPEWANDRYIVPPYHEFDAGNVYVVTFGPLEYGEGGGLGRGLSVEIHPHRSADAAVSAIRQEHRQMYPEGVPAYLAAEKTQIAGKNVVRYRREGLCSFPTLEVIGTDFNYIVSHCGSGTTNDAPDFAPLIRIVESMTLKDL